MESCGRALAAVQAGRLVCCGHLRPAIVPCQILTTSGLAAGLHPCPSTVLPSPWDPVSEPIPELVRIGQGGLALPERLLSPPECAHRLLVIAADLSVAPAGCWRPLLAPESEMFFFEIRFVDTALEATHRLVLAAMMDHHGLLMAPLQPRRAHQAVTAGELSIARRPWQALPWGFGGPAAPLASSCLSCSAC